jgi:Na+/alanine symporter
MGEGGIKTLNLILGIVIAILIAFILIGGVQRIGAVT